MDRVKVAPESTEAAGVAKISSGSTMLDLVLGGGWAQGRVVNIVGDRSSGKTLLAIEAMANYAIALTRSNTALAKHLRYAEGEAAFDHSYAKRIGMPDGVSFFPEEGNPEQELKTVEDFYNDLVEYLKPLQKARGDLPALYVLDSLDSLSDDAEMDRDIDKGSFGASKAKKLSEMFRRLVGDIRDANATLFIISQIRDKIGVTFGETKTRSGGRALDFYASQILWLAEIGKIKKTVLGLDRVVGVNVLCKTKKNKVGMPFRDCVIPIYFNYGVDDEESMIEFLKKNKKADMNGLNIDDCMASLRVMRKQDDNKGLRQLRRELKKTVTKHWMAIEEALEPTHRKYG